MKAVANGHIETFVTAPRLLRLKEMLHAQPYTEDADEHKRVEGEEEEGLGLQSPDLDVRRNANDPDPDPHTADGPTKRPTQGYTEAGEKRSRSDDAMSGRQPNKLTRDGREPSLPRHSPGHTWQEIVEEVQASEEEIKAGLSSLQAVQLGGRWRVVAGETMSEVLHCLVLTALAKGWPMSAILEREALGVCGEKGFREEVVRHCLRESSKGSKAGRCNETLWELDEKKVCVDYARKLLSNGEQSLGPFREIVEHAVHCSMTHKRNLKMADSAFSVRCLTHARK